jgi:hypothetical protein
MSSAKEKAGGLCFKENEVDSQLPPTAFNFSRAEQCRIDDYDVISNLPCRALYDWSLTRKTKSNSEIRAALPTDTYLLNNYTLSGTLMPLDKQQIPILIELDELEYYAIDQSRSFRGYWVITEAARYWLQQPCRKRVVVKSLAVQVGRDDVCEANEDDHGDVLMSEGSIVLPSQSHLHLFHRAQLGLLSNLIDIFVPTETTYHQHTLYNRAPGELYNLLSIKPELREYYNSKVQRCTEQKLPPIQPLFDHPFDLELLLSSNFLHPHIAAFHPDFKATTFFNGLQKHSNDFFFSLSLQTKQQENKWMKSAEEAERRSCQFLWGQPAAPTSTNLRYPLELEIERRFARAQNSIIVEQEADDASTASSIQSFHMIVEEREAEAEKPATSPVVDNYTHPNGVAACPSNGDSASEEREEMSADDAPIAIGDSIISVDTHDEEPIERETAKSASVSGIADVDCEQTEETYEYLKGKLLNDEDNISI